jgi:hypothetical protein
MTARRIVYTRQDGGVSVCAPSRTALAYMTGGGGRWNGFSPGFLDRQIAEQAKSGVGERAAAAFVRAMQFGGCSTGEAYAIMRDRFCAPYGSAFEVFDAEELPDRWFRNAWARSHNGGPICIDMARAREIQMRRIKAAARRHRAELELARWRERIRRVDCPQQLRHIWPKRLSP